MTNEQLLAAEVELEVNAVERAMDRYRASVEAVGLEETSAGQTLARRSIGGVIAAIEAWQDDAANGKAGRSIGLAKFLAQYNSDEVAMITLRHCVGAVTDRSCRMSTLAMSIVADLEAVDLEARLKKADPAAFKRYERVCNRNGKAQTSKIAILKRQGKYVGTFISSKVSFAWSPSERVQVGARLVEIVAEAAGFIHTVHAQMPGDRDTKLYVRATPQALAWVEAAHAVCEISRPMLYPMVVPPQKWVGTQNGGYLSNDRGFRRSLIKATSLGGYREEMADADIPLVTAAVNALQETRWAVNLRVLAVVQANIANGNGPTGVPMDSQVPVDPRRPDLLDTPRAEWTEAQTEEYKVWARGRSRYLDAVHSYQAAACTVKSQVQIAERMAGFPCFYFPHQLDYRGRAYPMPALLHPQGDDTAKGVLQFAGAKPLGEHGMKWLAIHGANSFGVDKVPFSDRLKWVRENTPAILEDAADPHRAGALWTQADSPLVFLAFAFEWTDLVQGGESPSEFLSRIPVGLDGSCNGLQHFSAMLRDAVGGAATNLVPLPRPADIYSLVAEKVRSVVEFETTSDDAAIKSYANFWNGVGITRKLTKRNTMTLPYGVTKIGMKDQLWEELGGMNATAWGESDVNRGLCVFYLAERNFDAISKTVAAAVGIMSWLRAATMVANQVPHADGAGKGLSMKWTTPDGLPIMQRYQKRSEIAVQLFGKRMKLTLRPLTDGLDGRRQRTGISPNFVHSVDAAHMRDVVRRLHAEGVTDFAMIHDSFGAHAGEVERLGQVTRDSFVDMHSGNVLEKFREELLARLPVESADELPPLPAMGTLDLELVRGADYFFA